MINGQLLKAINATPGQAVAIASFAQMYAKQPKLIRDVLEKHGQSFTGNPNIDFFQIYKLSEDRKRFFDEDYKKALNEAKYFSLGNVVDKLKDTVSNATNSIKNAAPQISQIAGGALNVFGPALGGLADAYLPGSSGAVSGLAQGLGAGLQNFGIKKAEQKLAETAAAGLPPAAAEALNKALSSQQNPNQNLDDNTNAQELLAMLKNMNPFAAPNTAAPNSGTPAKTMKIFGKEVKVWIVWTVAGVVVAAIVVTIILIVRAKNKKKIAAKS